MSVFFQFGWIDVVLPAENKPLFHRSIGTPPLPRLASEFAADITARIAA
jgi:hypothetical protein